MNPKYKITVKERYFSSFIKELWIWGIKETTYQIEANSIITSDKNVVDVATETFINRPDLINIEEV